MDALIASYGDASSDSDTDVSTPTQAPTNSQGFSTPLPPPPLFLLNPPNSLGNFTTKKFTFLMSV